MYNLHNLGWNSFQQLCLTITREVLGQTIESFLDSNDGGRDGAFTGQWNPTKHEAIAGQFVIQCKFTSRINYVLRPSDLSEEVTKVIKLVERGVCDSYILMTNAGLSGSQSREIESLFRDAGVEHIVILGSTWITQQIRENKRLRMLVPRVYGLGDLSQILDERAYIQAHAILETLKEDLAKVVVTDAYRNAATALDRYGFVLLIGEPAAGKTTIASMLAMAAIDQWNASILKLDDPSMVMEHWNPEEPSQFFWLDDAFGVSQYESSLVQSWNHILPQIKTMLHKGTKIVMTSRDYIYNRARKELKEGAFPLLGESQVVIDVHDLSSDEKRQILYNHLKLGDQLSTFRSRVKPYLESVATHKRFVPEIARRLADPMFTKDLSLDAHHLGQFVENRERFLQEVLQGLDSHSKAALALIYMRSGRLESPIVLLKSEELALNRLESNLGGCVIALESLKGSLVLFSHIDSDSIWSFKHPTIGDAYASNLAQNPELLGIYLQGIAPDKLIEQVTCGDVGIEKAVVIPKLLFPELLLRLHELEAIKGYKSKGLSGWRAENALQRFLTYRCSKEFLELYIEQNPRLLEKVSEPGLYLSAVSEVRLAVRINEFGLLPEEIRKKFVSTVSEYAILGEDLYALDNLDIQSLFRNQEFEELQQSVRKQLLPKLTNVRQDMQNNYSQGNESPEEYMQQLFETFDVLKKYFGDDEDAAKIIEEEIHLANEWIAENSMEEMDTTPRTIGKIESIEQSLGTRSIFDDIDT